MAPPPLLLHLFTCLSVLVRSFLANILSTLFQTYRECGQINSKPRLCIRRFGLEDPSLFSKSCTTSVHDSVFKRASSITFIVRALLEEKIRWNRKNDCANWLVSCSFVLFLARVRIVLLTNHQFQIEKYVNFGYFVKWKMEMNTLTLTMSAHGYITYRCLGWLTMKTKCTHGW